MTYTLSLSCPLCPETTGIKIDLPEGWTSRYDGTDDETAFCPKHAPIKDFADAQCPGCVSSWGEQCPMWKAFAFTEDKMTAHDYATLERGVCPRRVNGTIGFGGGRGVHDIDVRSGPEAAAGKAFAQAIREHIARYTKPK